MRPMVFLVQLCSTRTTFSPKITNSMRQLSAIRTSRQFLQRLHWFDFYLITHLSVGLDDSKIGAGNFFPALFFCLTYLNFNLFYALRLIEGAQMEQIIKNTPVSSSIQGIAGLLRKAGFQQITAGY